MATTIGANYWDRYGLCPLMMSVAFGSSTTFAMSAIKTGWCARIKARNANDITAVRINWSVVGTALFDLRIETIDTGSGRPTGTLYDANAVLTGQTPASGWQLNTFSTPPSTGLTPGNEYGIVVIITTGGASTTIRSHVAAGLQGSAYPCIVSTAADATTTDGTSRTGFSEVTQSVPIATIVFSDGSELPLDCSPWASNNTYALYGNAGAGAKVTVPSGATLSVRGIVSEVLKAGTPAGDLRMRILDSSNNLVSGATCTVSRNSLSSLGSARSCVFPFSSPVSLTGGTYRVIADSSSSANSSNCWRLQSAVANSSAFVDSAHIMTNTSDLTATPIVWSDTNTEEPPVGLLFDTESAGSSGIKVHPGMSGGMRG